MPADARVSSEADALGLDADSSVEPLLAAFLRAVTHDLRSPLMTLSLSAELLVESPAVDDRARVALDALSHGVRDMERMLDAITAVSRARSRILTDSPVRIAELVRGQVVISADVLDTAVAAIDPRYITESLAALSSNPSEVRVELHSGEAHLSVALASELSEVGESPLRALFVSLQRWAGTPIAALAAAEVQAARQGASLRCADGRLLITLPLLEAHS